MTAQIQNFSIYRYEDGTLNVNVIPPTAIGGWTFRFSCMKRFGGVSGLIQKYGASGYNGVSGITVTNSGQGFLTVALNSADTSGLDFQNYAYMLERTDTGNRTLQVEGYMSILPDGLP